MSTMAPGYTRYISFDKTMDCGSNKAFENICIVGTESEVFD